MHSLIKVTFGVMNSGAQKSFSGIKSDPEFQTQSVLLLQSSGDYWDRHPSQFPSARLEPVVLIGWQNSSVKRGAPFGAYPVPLYTWQDYRSQVAISYVSVHLVKPSAVSGILIGRHISSSP